MFVAKYLIRCILAAWIAGATVALAGEIPTAAPENVDPFFNGAREVEVLDWDGDGDLDIVGGAFDGQDIHVWRNQEFGWIELVLPITGPVKDLDVGDLDGDGTTDFVFALGNTAAANDRIGAVLNRSSALIVTINDSSVDNPNCITLADLDDDGDLDAVSCEFDSGEISHHYSSGDGETWFTVAIATPGGGPSDVLAHDVDLDGDLDLVVATSIKLAWLENRINQPASWLVHDIDSNVPSGVSVGMGDIDGDGEDEIVAGAVNTPLLAWWDRPAVITNAWAQTEIQSTYSVAEVDLRDVDQDGDLDVLATRWASGGDLRYWQNDGSASFTEQDLGGDYMTPRAAAPADFDLDGDLDFAIAGGNSDVVETIENQTIRSSVLFEDAEGARSLAGDPVPLAYGLTDLDGDGDLDIVSYDDDQRLRYRDDIGDAGTLLQATSAGLNDPQAFALADIDNDGDTDVVMGLDDGLEWLENNGFGNPFSRNTLNGSFNTIEDVLVLDLNRDGDLDIVGFDAATGDLYWWRNTGDGGGFFRNRIRSALSTYHDVAAGDVEGDGRAELILAAELSVKALIYVADTAFSETLIAASDAERVLAEDYDLDGDVDVIGYDPLPATVLLWSNDGSGGGWSERSTSFQNAVQTLRATDVDLDGDVDIFGGSFDGASWLENIEGLLPTSFGELGRMKSALLEYGDVDGDGDSDFIGFDVSAGSLDGEHAETLGGGALQFVETVRGQIRVEPMGAVDPEIEFGTSAQLLRVEVEHLGRSTDEPIELDALNVTFENLGMDLDAAALDELFVRLYLLRSDGGETTLAELTTLDQASPVVFDVQPSGGAELIDPPAGGFTSAASLAIWGELEDEYAGPIDNLVVRLTGAGDVVPEGLPLTPFPGGAGGSGLTLVNTLLFADGFESGDTGEWSSVSP